MKPIIVGLHNPYSADDADALLPYPDRSAGARLWGFLNSIDIQYLTGRSFNASAHKGYYARRLDRRNMLKTLPTIKKELRLAARDAANEMLLTIPDGATVVLLGREVFDAFHVTLGKQLRLMLIHPQVIDGVTWRWLPHPSGRSTAYNDPVIRTLAGLLLADIIETSTGE